MLSGRGKSRTGGSAAHTARVPWGARLTSGVPFGSMVRRRPWYGARIRSRVICRNARQFDPVTALGGLTFFAVMGLSAYGEWLAAMWLIRAISG
jgi:hypothetical protein